MLKTLVALAATAAVLSTTGCCWPLHGGHRGGRGGYDDRTDEQRPDPPRSGRGRPAPPSRRH